MNSKQRLNIPSHDGGSGTISEKDVLGFHEYISLGSLK
jgi:hypothetical protein